MSLTRSMILESAKALAISRQFCSEEKEMAEVTVLSIKKKELATITAVYLSVNLV